MNTFKSEIWNLTQIPFYVNTYTSVIVVVHPVTFVSLEQVIPHWEAVTGFMNDGLFLFLNKAIVCMGGLCIAWH